MSGPNRRLACYLPLAIVLATPGCNARSSAEYWRAGGEYTLTLVVTDRAELTPERQRALGPVSDTTDVALHLDSVRAGSLRGTYRADFHRVGLMVGAAGVPVQVFAGKVHGDSVEIELTPDATDAGLVLRGSRTGGLVLGSWYTESGSTTGRFRLRGG